MDFLIDIRGYYLSLEIMKEALIISEGNKSNYSLRDTLAVIFRQKWLIALVFVSVILIVASITWLLPNKYESRMKLLVKNSRAEIIVSPEQAGNMTLTSEVSEAQINSEIELIQSQDLFEAVARKTALTKQYLDGSETESPVAIEKAVRQLEKDLNIIPVKKSNIIDIHYSSYSPQQSVSVLRCLAELYLERHLQVHRVMGTDEFFKSQAAAYQQRLMQAELALADFEAKNNIVSLPVQKEMGLKQVIDSETDLQATDTSGRETAQRIEKIEQQIGMFDARIFTQRRTLPHQYSIERMNTMLVELRHKRTQLLTRFQPEDRLIKEIDQQIADTLVALDKVMQEQSIEQTSDINPLRQNLESELARAKTELSAKQARRDSVLKQMQRNQAKLSSLESTSLKHGELEREVKELKDNYQLFAKKRDESLIASALDKQKISNVSIAENPSVPNLPSGPNRKLNLLLGLFLAAFLGLGIGVGAEFLRDTVHASHELESISQYPVLATVPYRALGSREAGGYLLPEANSRDDKN